MPQDGRCHLLTDAHVWLNFNKIKSLKRTMYVFRSCVEYLSNWAVPLRLIWAWEVPGIIGYGSKITHCFGIPRCFSWLQCVNNWPCLVMRIDWTLKNKLLIPHFSGCQMFTLNGRDGCGLSKIHHTNVNALLSTPQVFLVPNHATILKEI